MAKARGKMRFIAAIPFLFAIQQLIEGLQWLAVKPSALSLFLGYAFLFFAFLLWPVYTPLVVYLNEPDKKRQTILKYFVGFGIIISIYLLQALIRQPLSIETYANSIFYNIEFSFLGLSAVYYVFVLVGSLFLSSDRVFRRFGLVLLISAILSHLIYYLAFTSVWCFFAAALSGLIYFYFRGKK